MQESQFTDDCLPCTKQNFDTIVDSNEVNVKIAMRQEIEAAIAAGNGATDPWLEYDQFLSFCKWQVKKSASFAKLTEETKLQHFAAFLKMSLPAFIFAVREFGEQTKTDRYGNIITCHPRKQANIKELSGLFMFDADHLPIPPQEVFARTQVPGFPFTTVLAHITSSGEGLRLVCEWRTELGNIADNQICLARELGLLGMTGTTGKPVTDDSCIDACRISYAPRRRDILFIDEQKLFF